MRRSALPLALLLLPACGGVEVDRTGADGRPTAGAAAGPATAPAPAGGSSHHPSHGPSHGPDPQATRSVAPAPSPAPVLSSAPSKPAAQGDVDGDGEPDEITYEGSQAVVVLSGGGVLRASTEADIAPEPPVTAGVEDLDRDGRAEVFVKVGQGASTGFLLALRYDGTRLDALRVDGEPLLLAYGGSATHGDGFSCTEAGTLLVRSASSEDGQAYALQTVTYRVSGGALVETGRTTGTGTSQADPEVAAAYVVDCRSVGEGG